MNIQIGNRIIGNNNPVFIIAELSCNHLQKYDLAEKSIYAMKESGVDAVKLQTYTPDTITIKCSNKYFQIKGGTLWDGKTLYDLYKEAYTPWEWQPKLKRLANKLGLILFSSPFDNTAVDFLNKMQVPAFKVASFELVDIPLIEYMAKHGKPMIMSTGIATKNEIYDAVKACRRVGNNQIALLKCTSEYPTPLEEVNLSVIPDMKKRFHTVVGISDHTMNSTVSLGAITCGAKIVEKHFILDRKFGGPDSKFSLNPSEFKNMVDNIRDMEKAMGRITYVLTPKNKKSRMFGRSLFVVKDMKKGERLTKTNVRSIRPIDGLPPKYLPKILGKKVNRDILAGTPLQWKMVAKK